MHSYRKVLFPGLRERRWVRRHRNRGHSVIHRSVPYPFRSAPCYWHCVTCDAKWSC